MWEKDFNHLISGSSFLLVRRTTMLNQVRLDTYISVGELLIFFVIIYFLWQVKVKVVTKVNVEDVELSVVDKEQNIKSKTLR